MRDIIRYLEYLGYGGLFVLALCMWMYMFFCFFAASMQGCCE